MKCLITGASSGIGKDMANYMRNLGYDLYLVSKDKDKLDSSFKDDKHITKIALDLSKEINCYKY